MNGLPELLLPNVFPELPALTLDGSPLIVKNTFIDVNGGAAPSVGRRRAKSEQPSVRSVTMLIDLRGRFFSHDGRLDAATTPSSGASARASPEASPGASPRASPASPAESRSEASDADAEEEARRTTVMLRNLPEAYNRAMLLEMLDAQGFERCYDFVYLPIDFGSRSSFGYAFVNLATPEDACRFMSHFQGFSHWAVPSDKVAAVNWSGKRQGLQGQVDRYRNSPMMHPSMPDETKPIVLQGGVRAEFPPPTEAVKRLRVRPSKARRAQDLGLGVICASEGA
mmetsp:Transcript_106466/g.301086  ORF Transcript_106466/g.301086 Transcript_106466/m.301086 type:complete len:283 (+) Transcript_106466:146-994(+)